MTGFLQRHAFQIIKIKRDIASSDHKAANEFSQELKIIISDSGYSRDADESGIFSKKSRESSVLEIFKRYTHIFILHACGDWMLKPLLIA